MLVSRLIKLIIFILSILLSCDGLKLPHNPNSKLSAESQKLNTVLKNLLTSTLLTYHILSCSPAYAINPALDGATKAMLYKKERSADVRAFDELPLAAKKRRALNYCKENERLRSVGYSSSSACNEDVLQGNFLILDGKAAVRASKTENQVSTSSSTTADSSNPTKSKVVDLSDLPLAAKKRRSLAACKRPEVRKFAGFGSEKKCTEKVLKGNYEPIIEALEYGI